MTDQFRATGLTHLMAVSGANLALLLAFVVLGVAFVAAERRSCESAPASIRQPSMPC